MSDERQKLIDLIFSMVYAVTQNKPDWRPPRVEAVHWVAMNLWDCGFKTVPMGSGWGCLTERYVRNEFDKLWEMEKSRG